ncbi:hypothetical protein PLICRDRAFT_38250 [Plicaturopsis crispa FD-325 SS-3]|nr:hypothetical protein PLICRDRAFT_38250 [Plicaturopsis crispa FD-325 SS-3]
MASHNRTASSSSNRARISHRLRPSPPPHIFTTESSPAIPDSHWVAHDFWLGVGMVIIQPATNKVVIVHDSATDRWFLPKGRKDIGESLEQAALREAYEETGYRAEFLPIITHTRAPTPPNASPHTIAPLNCEPFLVDISLWASRTMSRQGDSGGEYIMHWYVGQIGPDATRETGTGMPDEQGYVGHLVDPQTAYERLSASGHREIFVKAWTLWAETKQYLAGSQRAPSQSHGNANHEVSTRTRQTGH